VKESEIEASEVFAITDCGSTTTKAILIERVDGHWRQTYRGDAQTTVEAPSEDVTIGVRAALHDMQEACGRRILSEDGELLRPCRDGEGVDAYLSTSSAGGGLQMLVMGLVRRLSARSGEAAALGAGAIVTDVLAYDDLSSMAKQVERLRQARPDMILLVGGEDGGAVVQVVELAELLAAASTRSRTGESAPTPVVFAGNRDAAQAVSEQLGEGFELHVVKNVRPLVELEQLGPTREKIHELFLEHVMQQAPGYSRLSAMVDAPILPTPSAVGNMLRAAAKERRTDVVCVDIGGATTDLFSVCADRYHRTVSANLGMSYSATNVLVEAGLAQIRRWLPWPMDDGTLRNAVMNKTIRPTTVPDTMEELHLEQALAREAMRLAYDQHKRFATDLAGRVSERGFDSIFRAQGERSFVRPMDIGLFIGSGGVVSHAPRHAQAALMLIDSFEPEGVTAMAKDSIFMMPHLGVLASVCEEAALSVLEHDCLIDLCTCVAPVGEVRLGRPCLRFALTANGATEQGTLVWGELRRLDLFTGQWAELELVPVKGVNVGHGKGRPWQGKVRGGPVGLVLDARGRPLPAFDTPVSAQGATRHWLVALGAYTASELER
jgi:uncharacterized protein (TIGR01319 family)